MKITKKKRTLLLCGIIAAVLGVSVAFAAISANLTINGQATVEAAQWKLGFGTTDAAIETAETTVAEAGQDTPFPAGTINGDAVAPGKALTFKLPTVNNMTDLSSIINLTTANNKATYSFYIVNESVKDAILNTENPIEISGSSITYSGLDPNNFFKVGELKVTVTIGTGQSEFVQKFQTSGDDKANSKFDMVNPTSNLDNATVIAKNGDDAGSKPIKVEVEWAEPTGGERTTFLGQPKVDFGSIVLHYEPKLT